MALYLRVNPVLYPLKGTPMIVPEEVVRPLQQPHEEDDDE